MPSLKFIISGIPDVKAAIKNDAARVTAATQAAMYDASNVILARATQLAPFDEGFLAASGQVDEQFATGHYEVTISFGNNNGPQGSSPTNTYAIVQHERLDFWHPPKPPARQKSGKKRQGTGPVKPGSGRGPKYLEYPFSQWAKNFPDGLLPYIRKHYHGGKA